MRQFVLVLLLLGLAGCATEPDELSDLDPQKAHASAKAHTELAAAYYERAQYKIALDELATAIRADSDYAPAYNMRGLVHMTLLENAEAEQDFRRSLEIDSANPDANINYGWFLCQRGREKDAIGHFMVAARDPLYQTPEKAYLNAGLCSKMAGHIQDAETYLQRALLMRPELPDALVQLAEVSFINGDYAGAKSYLLRFERTKTPFTAGNLLLAVRIERGLGDRRAQAAYAAQLSKDFPDSREAQLLKQIK
jgi:type IV pilus assembly protein PilF